MGFRKILNFKFFFVFQTPISPNPKTKSKKTPKPEPPEDILNLDELSFEPPQPQAAPQQKQQNGGSDFDVLDLFSSNKQPQQQNGKDTPEGQQSNAVPPPPKPLVGVSKDSSGFENLGDPFAELSVSTPPLPKVRNKKIFFFKPMNEKFLWKFCYLE